MAFEHNDVQFGALESGFGHCDVMLGRIFNLIILEQSQVSANCSFGSSIGYASGSDHLDWGRCEWKVTTTDTRASGNMNVTFHIDSGLVDGGIILRRGYFHDPDLTGDTSNVEGTLTAGNSYTAAGSSSWTYQDSYFDLDPGWNTWNVSFHIETIRWREGLGAYVIIWSDGIQGSFNHSCVRFG